VYGGLYDSTGATAAPEMVAKLSAWLESLPPDVEFVSQGFQPELAGTRFEGAFATTAPHALAGAIARIAYARLVRGEALDPAALDANYVRRSDAELFWKE
jgi:tRNA threonylcarbamoyladenosine biosynthesis protein TsaB